MVASVLPFPPAYSIIPSEVVACLRTRRRGPSSSGYRNVYLADRDENGDPVWKAKIKRAGTLRQLPGSKSHLPHVCALHVAAWYEQEFGPHWQSVLRWRKKAAYEVRHSEKYGGFLAAAWVMGSREEVVELRQHRRAWALTDQLAVFASRQEAVAGVKRYMRRRYGLFSECILYRCERGGTRKAA